MAQVLVVEDDPGAARLAELALAMEGHTIDVVRSGADFVERLGGEPADLVLLDVMLPDANGLDLLESLRGADTWQQTRVVLVTALDSNDDAWRFWSSGVDYYLTKPVDLPLMRSVVERLLAGDDPEPEPVER